jgi:hypothetical protein
MRSPHSVKDLIELLHQLISWILETIGILLRHRPESIIHQNMKRTHLPEDEFDGHYQ